MFDVILIDSPPVQLVSDATILAGVANALVFVVRADSTPYQVAKGAMEQLKKGKAHLLGVVLNRLDVDKAEHYYGYAAILNVATVAAACRFGAVPVGATPLESSIDAAFRATWHSHAARPNTFKAAASS